MGYTLGIDTSFYQDRDDTPQVPDYRKAYEAGARFSFHRIGQGKIPDSDFLVNWKNALVANLLRGGYLFYDYRYRVIEQTDLVFALLGDDRGELPIVFDLERVPTWENGVKKYVPLPPVQSLYVAIDQFIDIALKQDEGRYPILYTNLEFLYYIITKPTEKMLKCPLWVAAYNPSAPTKVGAWKKWAFWQYTSHGDGRKFGMESGNIDLDWFNGSYEELVRFARQIPPSPVLTLEQRVKRLEDSAVAHGWVLS